MISIIISSYIPEYFNALEDNISQSIGVPYEIIRIHNPGLMGICTAYNQGAEKAKYDNLLFIHEDILFRTENWGAKLIIHLNKPDSGVIGIAGSSYIPSAPSSWTVSEKYNFVNILQGNKENKDSFHIGSTKKNMNKVFAVDGVFLAVTKKKYINYKFNEELKGFHGYDLDFSLRISKNLQNYVVDDILIEHFSKGNLDKIWFDTNMKIRENLGSDFQKTDDPETEKKAFLGFLYKYFEYYPINKKNIFFTLKFYPWKRLTFKDHFLIVKKYLNYIRYSSGINKKTNTNI
ncbi:hypothetical protein M2347_001652 [Chryseobacterium sp. H1D6B]|uniref:glycosyltransferase n=1 Tax=Chryseobacterium sp. H1D6B TaxID=2940588 RepID=UPI0015C6D588|nr:glycosyltransferase [Chryseobacterium sp. H1D6B]MDH6251925.1 hypothetical protein [Chryseobacterium sp. H1D6B]